jgi:oligoendopeptidase F
MENQLPLSWDLEVIFPGGSESKEFASFLDSMEADIADFQGQVEQKELALQTKETFLTVVSLVQSLAVRIRQAGAFISCLTAQNVKDEAAKQLNGRVKTISAAYSAALSNWEQHLLEIEEADWNAMLTDDELLPIAFNLEERRRRAKDKMPTEQEVLASDLAVDGYHAWSDLYNTIVGRISIEVELDGETKQLSVGQAANLASHTDRKVREMVFAKWKEAWGKETELVAMALNHLGGFRLALYRHRGWDSLLSEPLEIGRMQEKTLDAMWQAINNRRDKLVAYLNRKAKLLGIEKLGWLDVGAPLGSNTKKVSYDEAAAMIVEHFGRFNPNMADFAQKAFDEAWIEAEDRPGKRPGGFCTSFPVSDECGRDGIHFCRDDLGRCCSEKCSYRRGTLGSAG